MNIEFLIDHGACATGLVYQKTYHSGHSPPYKLVKSVTGNRMPYLVEEGRGGGGVGELKRPPIGWL
jgi:hypothetical protein